MPDLSHIPFEVRDLLAETRYGITFPCDSGCQMRFVHRGVNRGGGFYAYSQYGGVRPAVKAAIEDNLMLRKKYRRKANGKPTYRYRITPKGALGVVGLSFAHDYDRRRDVYSWRYQAFWRKDSKPRSRTFYLQWDATPDQHLHAFRTALQFRKEWEALLGEFDPARYTLWCTHRLYEPGHPRLPDDFWD
ncbi:MAG: hypothetical protein AWU57_49 [Marinobacter sp. T13-3]|nr:MAG: hypothetical protein AWU57_49 [Marinobacter sp. T13-3]